MFKNENQQKLLLNHVLCIVLILNPCVIAMMIVGVLIKVAKTLNHDGCDQIEAKKKNRKIQIITHMCLWPFLPNQNLGQFDLCQWLGNVTKHIRTTFESKKLKSKQNRMQNLLTYDNGPNCHLYHDTHFEPLD